MKHTLKTMPRPNFTVHETKTIAMQYAIDVEAWLQGFERELRQRFSRYETEWVNLNVDVDELRYLEGEQGELYKAGQLAGAMQLAKMLLGDAE